MTDPKPANLQQARDLLLPGTYRHDPKADLYVNNVDETLRVVREGEGSKLVLTRDEVTSPDWTKIAKERLGWPT